MCRLLTGLVHMFSTVANGRMRIQTEAATWPCAKWALQPLREATDAWAGLLPPQVNIIEDRTCRAAEGPELKPACARSCDAACSEGLDAYAAASSSSLGVLVPAKAQARIVLAPRPSLQPRGLQRLHQDGSEAASCAWKGSASFWCEQEGFWRFFLV